MSDDYKALVVRLRNICLLMQSPSDRKEVYAAADAIEALMAERDDARGFNNKTFEVLMSRLHSIKESLEYYAARAKRAEAALREIADTDPDEGTDWFHRVANSALAKIKKEMADE